MEGPEVASATERCRAWCAGDVELVDYHDHEWCKPSHDERFQFEMLCLEGASVGLSWRCVLHKREAYREAFHDFDVDACAAMGDDELEALMGNVGIIRNRAKVFGVRRNARVVQEIRREFGSLDAYLWGFVDGMPVDGLWSSPEQMPTQSDVSRALSSDLRRRGMSFVGPVITYSFLQAIGMVNDHLVGCSFR